MDQEIYTSPHAYTVDDGGKDVDTMTSTYIYIYIFIFICILHIY